MFLELDQSVEKGWSATFFWLAHGFNVADSADAFLLVSINIEESVDSIYFSYLSRLSNTL